MASGPEHYREAEENMAAINGKTKDAVLVLLGKAQVHATLALAAATALVPSRHSVNNSDTEAWHEVAS